MKTNIKALAVLALCFALSACSALQGLGAALSPSGPRIDATAQVGAENRQEGDSVLDNRRVDARREDRQEDRRVEARVEEGGVSTVTQTETRTETRKESKDRTGVSSGDWSSGVINVNQIPDKILVLLLFLLVLGWILPSPADIFRGLGKGILFFRDLIKGRI